MLKHLLKNAVGIIISLVLVGVGVVCFALRNVESSDNVYVSPEAHIILPIVGLIFGGIGLGMLIAICSGKYTTIQTGPNTYQLVKTKDAESLQEEYTYDEQAYEAPPISTGGFCGECGAPLKAGAKFCTECGSKRGDY